MKQGDRKMLRKQAFELWTWLTLLAVLGAYLGTSLVLYIVEALQA